MALVGSQSRKMGKVYPGGLLFLLVAAFSVRAYDIGTRGLWYDELQSVTHAILPVQSLLASVGQFDPHPPLYYLQLHFWILLGTTDAQIKLNSVLWSLAALLSLAHVSKEAFGAQRSLTATALFAFAPFAVIYSQEARMYSMLMCLSIGQFYVLYLILKNRITVGRWVALLAVTLAILYSHGAAFLIFLPLSLCFLMHIRSDSGRSKEQILAWLLLFLILILSYWPWLQRARTVFLGHTMTPTVTEIVDTLFLVQWGFNGRLPSFILWIATTSVFALWLYAWNGKDKNSQLVLLGYVVAPILATLFISYSYRPIWLHRTFAFSLPFMCLCLALAIPKLPTLIPGLGARVPQAAFIAIGLLLVAQVLAIVAQQRSFLYEWDFRSAASFIAENAKADDRLYVPNERVFWGVAWYLLGPGQISPLHPVSLIATKDSWRTDTTGESPEWESRDFWVVRREIDPVSPIADQKAAIAMDFRKLHVLYFSSKNR